MLRAADARLAVWQVLAQRRSGYDNMMWQTPALGMTAQAFLLTLALAPDTSVTSRVISSGLGALISVMVLQLLGKHRQNEVLDSRLLERLERDEVLGLAKQAGFVPHGNRTERHPPEDLAEVRESSTRVLIGPGGFWGMSSFVLWCVGEYLIILVCLLIIVLSLIGLEGLFHG